MAYDEVSFLLGLAPSAPSTPEKREASVALNKSCKRSQKPAVATRSHFVKPIDSNPKRNLMTRDTPKPNETRNKSPPPTDPLSEDSDKPTKETMLTVPLPRPELTSVKPDARSYALPSDSLWMYNKPTGASVKEPEVKEKDYAEGVNEEREEGLSNEREPAVKLETAASRPEIPHSAQSLLDQLMAALDMSTTGQHPTGMRSVIDPQGMAEIVVKQEDGFIEMVKAPTSSTLADGVDTADESFLTETEDKPRRRFHVAQHQTRVKGSNRRRTRYQIVRYVQRSTQDTGRDLPQPEEDVKPDIEVIPDTPFQRDVQSTFSRSALDQITELAKIDNTSGNYLPSQLRDIFPALSDPTTAVTVANHLRHQIGLAPLSTKTDKVALRRAVAQMRVGLYTELVSALVLPSAPEPAPDTDDEEERVKRNKISLAPSAIVHLQKALPAAFPEEKYTIKLFLAHHGAFGEPKGKVVWQDGIGKMVGGDPSGPGFRGKVSNDGLVHVFVDHSNVLHGLTHCLHKFQSSALPPKHLRTLSLPVLSLLLRRGRPTPHGSLHLVASSPKQQNLDPLVRLGWEVSVLKRVEIYDDEVPAKTVLGPGSIPKNQASPAGLRRYKEQGVDEILHLKILQALNTKPTPAPKGSTIVLATGDAKGGQFNQDGFLGAVREAIKRGWKVELWSFREGMSRTWKEVKRKEGWEGSFTIRVLDEWAEQLVEVGDGD